jgi:hypothetical protein
VRYSLADKLSELNFEMGKVMLVKFLAFTEALLENALIYSDRNWLCVL